MDFADNYHRIEIESEGTKRHKWDGILENVDNGGGKGTVTLVEFAGGFGTNDKAKLQRDSEEVYRNAARLLNKHTSNDKHHPQIFIVLTHDRTIHFESLTLVDNLTYARTRAAEIQVPYSAAGLNNAMKCMPDVFAWLQLSYCSFWRPTSKP